MNEILNFLSVGKFDKSPMRLLGSASGILVVEWIPNSVAFPTADRLRMRSFDAFRGADGR